jgi:hypothetical protein
MTAESPQSNRPKQRQAVILIHGIGEQRPMDTLRSFVDAVLDYDYSGSQADVKYYSRPDFLSDNLELRRYVSANARNDRTDFYEFYWAHRMPAATWDRLLGWFWVLTCRNARDVPAQLMPIWALSWLAIAVSVLLGLWTTARFVAGDPVLNLSMPLLLAAVANGIALKVLHYIGDAAVYLSPNPKNIAARQDIRAAGMTLLDNVTKSGRYDRVLIVGHSLGSVIGYDILTFAWQRTIDAQRKRLSGAWKSGSLPQLDTAALRKAEAIAKDIRNDVFVGDDAALKWQDVTRRVADELAGNGYGWLVTDFITLGSPLAHGDLLLAKNRADFVRRAMERELPHCPPVRELDGKFSFQHRGVDQKDGRQNATILNHGAVFAAVAWTNLYFPCRRLFAGDPVGGPVAPLFWPGVRDVKVATRRWRGWFAHTRYWDRQGRHDAPVQALRDALDLKRTRFPKGAAGQPSPPPQSPSALKLA